MNASQLRPAHQLAQRFGVKSVCYGGPGVGKTPLINTAPSPVLCVVEPGMLSMRTSNVPCFQAFDSAAIAEFFDWIFRSPEAKRFDTVGIDSISQMAEIILKDQLKRNKDGRKAYGEMSRIVTDYTDGLYYLQQKHVYLIAKQMIVDDNGTQRKKPYFPGQDLNVKIPHLYDEILHAHLANIPNVQKPVVAIRTTESYDAMARDRSGNLAELEPPNLTEIFAKCMR